MKNFYDNFLSVRRKTSKPFIFSSFKALLYIWLLNGIPYPPKKLIME